MNILVVSGFLGAGKTTFIRTLAQRTGGRFAVYENEFGESGIDTRTLERDNMSVWESTENCICCTGKTDFANAVLTISNSLNPENLVVEPSGAAQLGPLLETIGRVCYDQIGLLRPVTLVDSCAYSSQRAAAPDLWEDQVRNAGVLICTKGENLFAEELDRLHDLLTEINPTAEILTQDGTSMPDSWWDSLLRTARSGAPTVQAESSASPTPLDQITLRSPSVPSPVHLFSLLDDIVRGQYGRILRAKGVISSGGQRLRFELVDGRWNVTACEGSEQAAATFIGIGLRRSALRQRLSPANNASQELARRRTAFARQKIKGSFCTPKQL